MTEKQSERREYGQGSATTVQNSSAAILLDTSSPKIATSTLQRTMPDCLFPTFAHFSPSGLHHGYVAP